MEKTIETKKDWKGLAHQLGKDFAGKAATYDQKAAFVGENYDLLKQHRLFAALIPETLGGEGMPHATMCDVLRILAQYCGSTALALSMHQHLLAANIWRYKNGKGSEEMLRKVAGEQLILVSTGANDWLDSSGTMEKTEGGYFVSASKNFASQSPVGNVLVTSAQYNDPEKGPQVLHFPVAMKAEGVSVMDNWYTLGMRGTGSHTVKLERVFVPDTAIVLARPQGEYHPVWNIVLMVAMPLIMSVYVGIAERAAQVALEKLKSNKVKKPYLQNLVGELFNALTNAQVLLKDMVSMTNEYNFEPENHYGNAILIRKTLIANACLHTVNKAMELVGGQGFYREFELERLFRDVQGAPFHPLPEKEQQRFTGEFLLQANK